MLPFVITNYFQRSSFSMCTLSKIFRLAAESDEHDDGIGEILQASDDIAR